ncbi:MAG: sugar transferase [Hyphomicrobiales bacterium]|nr:sugar transferase [Hyphomicrobiales bacterium]
MLNFALMTIVAIVAPMAAKFVIDGPYSLEANSQWANTLVAVFFAAASGYLAIQELIQFPGRMLIGNVIFTFSAPFVLMSLAFFVARIDYSRIQFIGGFLVCVIWTILYYSITHRRARPAFAVVPFGAAERLLGIEGVDWIRLDAPASPPPRCQGVVVDLASDLPQEWRAFITGAALQGVRVFGAQMIAESLTGKVELEHLSENGVGGLNPNYLYLHLKQAFDFLSALVALIVLAPLFAVVAIAIRLDSKGPAFFTQKRVGFRGRVFRIYKFRTMTARADAGAEGRDEAMTQHNDERVTRLGRFLRNARIDELPQIINILRGEMSWIGPRPEAVALSQWYTDHLPYYAYRHVVRPGISGWAQVNQGHVAELDEAREKLKYDFFYIKNFSLWLDFLICLTTAEVVFSGYGAR